MTVAALVLGAGSGERLRESLGAGVRESEREDEAPWGLPKAFVPLAGRCLLVRSLVAVAASEEVDLVVPVLIENTAGGGNAAVRSIDNYGPLWEVIGDLNVGVCLDTCHAWAAGEDLETVVSRLKAATGRIDLVHCNDSRDPHDSRRDRHANLGKGKIPGDFIVDVVREADAPVVVETPDDEGGQAADIAWLRERLA